MKNRLWFIQTEKKFSHEIKIITFYTSSICSQGYWAVNLYCSFLLTLNFSKEPSPVVTVNSLYFVADNRHLFVHLTKRSWALDCVALLTLKSVPNVRMEEAFFCVCPASKWVAPLQLNDSLPGSWQVSPPVPWLHMHHWNEILRPRFTLSYFSMSFLRFYYQTPYPFLAKCPLLSLFYSTVFYPSPWFLLLLFTSSKIHSIHIC